MTFGATICISLIRKFDRAVVHDLTIGGRFLYLLANTALDGVGHIDVDKTVDSQQSDP